MAPLVSQDRVGRTGQFVAVIHARINIDRYHVGPMVEVFLFRRSEFVLRALRPAMKIIDLLERESRAVFLRRQRCRCTNDKKQNKDSSQTHSCPPDRSNADLRLGLSAIAALRSPPG